MRLTAVRPAIREGVSMPAKRQNKSKGGFQEECYTCGEIGLPARECPKGKGAAGKARGGFKGKGEGAWGTGIWQVDGGNVHGDWQWDEPEKRRQVTEKK